MDNLRAQNLGRVLIVHVRCSESIKVLISGNTKGGSITNVDLLFDWFGISCMINDNCFYLLNRLIQTSQTGGQWYNDTSPFSITYSR